MSARPWMMFYFADWRGNAKLRRCTFAERGIWLEVMGLMHDNDDYGILRWPLVDVAQAIGCRVGELQSLRRKGVLKGADTSERCQVYIHQGHHARQPLPPVTLIPEQDGPIWFSSRMVLDEHLRERRGAETRFSQDRQPTRSPSPGGSPDHSPSRSPARSPTGRQGDGLSESESESERVPTADAVGMPDGTLPAPARVVTPDCPHEKIIALYHELMPSNPRTLVWNNARRGYLRTRWTEMAKPNGAGSGYRTVEQGLAWWRQFFEGCTQSSFLTGRTEGRDGGAPFLADLEWLVRPKNFAKVIEGKYRDRRASAKTADTDLCACGALGVVKVGGQWRCPEHREAA